MGLAIIPIVLRLNSVIFNSFVFMQIFSEINSYRGPFEHLENIQKSPIFVGIIIVTIATQVAFIGCWTIRCGTCYRLHEPHGRPNGQSLSSLASSPFLWVWLRG